MCLSQSAFAQSKRFYPDRPKHFYTDKWWLLGRVVSAAATGVDAWSTGDALQACPGCQDRFAFFPVHSKGTIAAAASLGFGISTGFSIAEWYLGPRRNSGKSFARIVAYAAQPVTDGVAHGWDANNNWTLVAQCRSARLVCK